MAIIIKKNFKPTKPTFDIVVSAAKTLGAENSPDTVNTNGERAVHEVADMIGQVHARSPEQAQELFDKTAQGIAPENRALFEWAMDGHIADQKAASQPTEAPDAGSPSNSSANLDIGAGLKDTDGNETLSISIDPANAPTVGMAGTTAAIPVAAGEFGKDLAAGAAGAARAGAGAAVPTLAGTGAAAATLLVPVNETRDTHQVKVNGQDASFVFGPGDLHQTVYAKDPRTGEMQDTGFGAVYAGEDADGNAKLEIMPIGEVGDYLKGQMARTDIADPMPNTEVFPAHDGDPSDGILKGRPAEPDRVINSPPYEMPEPGQYNTPPSEDQSSDSNLGGGHNQLNDAR